MSIGKEEWALEQAYLNEALREIDRQLAAIGDTESDRRSDVIDLRKSIWEMLREDQADADSRVEAALDVLQSSQELARIERGYAAARREAGKLRKLRQSAYFGRIDFQEEGYPEAEPIYIGLASLTDAGDRHLIYDWRTPIASLYYDYAPGPAAYMTDFGAIQGKMTLKRQFQILLDRISLMFDTGIQIGDEMLMRMLERGADDKMHSIVTTIQAEQNRIIRNDRQEVLIVQGAAGSGKTSVALQRAAYLLYKHRKVLSADKMILFSPNPLFSDYISNVLPELGEQSLRQTTFQDYAEFRLGGFVKLQDRYEQLEYMLTSRNDPDYATVRASAAYKTSAAFLKVVRRCIDLLGEAGMRFQPLLFGSQEWMSADELRRMFYKEFASHPLSGRLERMQARLSEQLGNLERDMTARAFRKLRREPKYMGSDPELKRMAAAMVAKRIRPLKESIDSLAFVDTPSIYADIFRDENRFLLLASDTVVPREWERIRQFTLRHLENRFVPYEDTAALLYLTEAVTGSGSLNGIRHVLIDEAQDYSPFQYEMIRRLFPRSRMTLLGDLNQAIQPDMRIGEYDELTRLFGEERTEIVRLTKCYRSTAPLVAFTKALLPGGEAIEAVGRPGRRPSAVDALTPDALPAAVLGLAAEFRREGAASIAVIGKSAAESLEAYRRLCELGTKDNPQLLTKDDTRFKTGFVVLPAYLAKGLEFDAVIIYNAGNEVYGHEEERKLFYTACTRAMHRLALCFAGRLSRFVEELGPHLYDRIAAGLSQQQEVRE